jgi:hypothetical protein
VGGTGPQTFSYACPDGQLISGLDLDTQVNPGTGGEYIAGMRFICGSPPGCPPASPAPLPVQPPPAALPLPSPLPAPIELPNGTWTQWYGTTQGPGTYGGLCSCASYITAWNVWVDAAYVGAGGEQGAITGLSAVCSGPDQLAVEALLGVGAPQDSTSNPAGFNTIPGQYGTYIASILDMGGTAPNAFNAVCPGGLPVSGFAMDTQTVGGSQYVTAIQFLCGDTVDCGGAVLTFPPPAAAQGAAPAPSPPALAPPPPAPPLPPGTWSPWYSLFQNPPALPQTGVLEGACPCGQHITVSTGGGGGGTAPYTVRCLGARCLAALVDMSAWHTHH